MGWSDPFPFVQVPYFRVEATLRHGFLKILHIFVFGTAESNSIVAYWKLP